MGRQYGWRIWRWWGRRWTGFCSSAYPPSPGYPHGGNGTPSGGQGGTRPPDYMPPPQPGSGVPVPARPPATAEDAWKAIQERLKAVDGDWSRFWVDWKNGDELGDFAKGIGVGFLKGLPGTLESLWGAVKWAFKPNDEKWEDIKQAWEAAKIIAQVSAELTNPATRLALIRALLNNDLAAASQLAPTFVGLVVAVQPLINELAVRLVGMSAYDKGQILGRLLYEIIEFAVLAGVTGGVGAAAKGGKGADLVAKLKILFKTEDEAEIIKLLEQVYARYNKIQEGVKIEEILKDTKGLEETIKELEKAAKFPRKPIDATRPQHGTVKHDATAFNKAKAWEKDAATIQARFNQDLVDANGVPIPGFRPDAQRIRVTPDGRRVVDITEVRSPTQTPAEMDAKIKRYREVLGDQAGEINWIEPIDNARK